MTKEKKAKPWMKDLLVAFAGTTLSIILTFGTSALINHVNRNRDRKLTALMILSSTDKTIENIFSSNTDIWKNVGNFQFIDNVGKSYAALRETNRLLPKKRPMRHFSGAISPFPPFRSTVSPRCRTKSVCSTVCEMLENK